MRLGIIGYSNTQGLGVMNSTLMEQFDFNVHLIIPGGEKGTDESLSKAKNKILAKQWTPSDEELEKLFSMCNVVVTIETDFGCKLFEKAKAAGIKTIFIPMFEWFEWNKYYGADCYICTSRKTFEYLHGTIAVMEEDKHILNKIIDLPWPIDTNKFKFKERGLPKNLTFVHNAGFGGLNWRKGTIETIQAFSLLTNTDARLLFRSQLPIEKFKEIKDILINDTRIIIDNTNWINNYDMYNDGDVYVYPARYDGQALVAEEAMACGLPTLVTDAQPMNEFSYDNRFKIKVQSNDKFKIHNHEVELNICDVNDLVEKMNWCIDTDLREVSKQNRGIIEEHYSWEVLRAMYEEILCS